MFIRHFSRFSCATFLVEKWFQKQGNLRFCRKNTAFHQGNGIRRNQFWCSIFDNVTLVLGVRILLSILETEIIN
uniref:Protoporphyrinogen IX oxidase n=1 Tax=Arundo donax TaxID=35708 RepID=A0A0A9DLR5_ARUDO